MKPRSIASLALVFAAALAAASPAPSRIVLGGRAVVMVADAAYLFRQAPERIVAVATADQGLGTFLAALDPGYGAKPALDRAAGPEVYAALKPDLVVMKSANRKAAAPGLDALGIRQLYIDLETPEDYLRELVLLGEAFGDKARAEALVAYYREGVERIEGRIKAAPAAAAPRVLVVQAGAADGSLEVPPASWMQTILVERAGGVAVWKGANPGSGWAKIGPEQVAAWNPDLVLVISYKEDSAKVAAGLRADPRFAGLAFAKAGKAFGFPQDFYSWDQPDSRWLLGFQWAAARIRPELFADFDLRAEARRFFYFGYGLDRPRFDALILPRLRGDL